MLRALRIGRGARIVAIICALNAVAGTSYAHTTAPGWRLTVDSYGGRVDGLTVDARYVLGSQIVVHNKSSKVFEVVGSDGVAFLRIARAGIEANVASPDWYQSENPTGDAFVPATARSNAPPRWAHIASGGDWAWFEHRIGSPGAPVAWKIPARIDDEDVDVHGTWVRTVVTGSFNSVLGGVHPKIPGLEVRVLPGRVPAIFVNNLTGRTLEIPGARGEPFLRIGKRGVEQAVENAGDAKPEWKLAGRTPRWAWVDRRAGWESAQPPARARDATSTVLVRRWRIPAKLEGASISIDGRLDWVPLAGHHAGRRGPSPFLFGALALSVLLIGAVLAARRRARHPNR